MDSILISSQSMEDISEFAHEQWQVDYYTQAKSSETLNQDSLMILKVSSQCLVLAVADGMGGHASGELASQLLLETIRHEIHKYNKGKAPLLDTILNGIMNGHKKIQSKYKGAGTTLCLACIDHNKVQFFSVGDSLGLVVSGKNFITYQTWEHSPVGHLLASGTLTEKDAIVHKDKNLLDNVLGYDPLRVEVSSPITLSARDSVMLLSDGIRNLDLLENLVGQLKVSFRKKNANEFLSQFDAKLMIDDLSLINLRALNYQ